MRPAGPIRLNYMPGKPSVGNFGDLLSAVIVAAFSGRAIRHVPAMWLGDRLVAIGTIGQRQKLGRATLWGTGIAGGGDLFQAAFGWQRPRFTRLSATALRGPFSAAMFRRAGLEAPAVFGDPAVLLPRLWPDPGVPKRHELGVFVHVSETAARAVDTTPKPEFRRYWVPPGLADAVVVRHTLVERNLESMQASLHALLACKRVLSTGLHALVIAEAYGIPCAVFDIHGGPHAVMAPEDDTQPLDHRMRDFYAGLGARRVPVFRTKRRMKTDWRAAMRFIDAHWEPRHIDTAPLIESFPERFGTLRATPDTEGLAERLGW